MDVVAGQQAPSEPDIVQHGRMLGAGKAHPFGHHAGILGVGVVAAGHGLLEGARRARIEQIEAQVYAGQIVVVRQGHVKGKALELLAIYLTRLIDLEFKGWRTRSADTGGAEVDAIVEGARLIFSRWQVQAKNTAIVRLDDVAKEVGLALTFVYSNVVLMVTTGDFTRDAYSYAHLYTTQYGAAYLGDALTYLRQIERKSVDLIVTSPPFALKRKKEYGNVDAKDYVPWLMEFAVEFKRVLKDKGSLVIDIGGTWVKGQPTRSLYHFELVIALYNLGISPGARVLLVQSIQVAFTCGMGYSATNSC